MTATTWNLHLDQAMTNQAVIAVCDRFVTTLTFQELGQIPAACQPHGVVEAADVGPYAERLAARLGEDEARARPLLERMSAFFTQAALRVVQIAHAQPKPADSSVEPRPVVYPYK